jgi:single-stranded-DNA-specific exonuclease
VFAARAVEVLGDPAILKEKHLRVNLRQSGRTLTLKAWNAADRLGELPPGERVDAAFCFEPDEYSAARGYPGWCAVLKDFRKGAGASA